MANDIFGYKRNPKANGVFSSEDSKLIFGTTNGGTDAEDGGYLVQNWNVGYQQQVQEIFEIGSNNLYWSKGKPSGTGTLGRVIGPKESSYGNGTFFPAAAYDICNGGVQLSLQAKSGNCADAAATSGSVSGTNTNNSFSGINITMDGCVVTGIGFSMNVGDVRLMENMGWRFAHMEIE